MSYYVIDCPAALVRVYALLLLTIIIHVTRVLSWMGRACPGRRGQTKKEEELPYI